jgi:hypothetical protein
MKKTLLIIVVVAFLACAAAAGYAVSASTDSISIYGRTQYIAWPLVPFNPDPKDYTNGPLAAWVDPGENEGINADDILQGRNPLAQTPITFPTNFSSFPNILMGDGYIAVCVLPQGTVHHTLPVSGVDISDTNAWISLPGQTGGSGGWHYVGIPYPTSKKCLFRGIVVTNGVEAYTMNDILEEIVPDPGWMDVAAFGRNAASQTAVTIPDQGAYLKGGQMYLIHTKVNNLALILPIPVPLSTP